MEANGQRNRSRSHIRRFSRSLSRSSSRSSSRNSSRSPIRRSNRSLIRSFRRSSSRSLSRSFSSSSVTESGTSTDLGHSSESTRTTSSSSSSSSSSPSSSPSSSLSSSSSSQFSPDRNTSRFRKICIVRKGLQLLKQCKVPQFYPVPKPNDSDYTEFRHLQRQWAKKSLVLLPRMVRYLDKHKAIIFGENFGQVTREARMYFLLVFFEQTRCMPFCILSDYQLERPGHVDLLCNFNEQMERCLTLKENAAVLNCLFQYYGAALALKGWQSRPGDITGFLRICYYVWNNDIFQFNFCELPMMGLAEKLSKELLGYKPNFEYRAAGLFMLYEFMKDRYLKKTPTNNAEDILNLVLPLTVKKLCQDSFLDRYELWEIVYYAVLSIPYKISSLDDEIMRLLVANLIDQKFFDFAYTLSLARMLLLDLPETRISLDLSGNNRISINDDTCNLKSLIMYTKRRLQTNIHPKYLRISIRQRLRVGMLLPKIITWLVPKLYKGYQKNELKCFNLLLALTLYPIEQSGYHMQVRLLIIYRLLKELHSSFSDVIDFLVEWSKLDAGKLRKKLCKQNSHHWEMFSRYAKLRRELKDIITTVHEAINEMFRLSKNRPISEQCHQLKAGSLHMITVLKGLVLVMKKKNVLHRSG